MGSLTLASRGTQPLRGLPRSTRRKRKRGKKGKAYPKIVNLRGNAKSFLSSRCITQLLYTDTHSQTTTTSMHVRQFRAISLFDPDFTGTGHQPKGYDQMAILYLDYRVRAVKLTATIICTTGNQGFVAGISWQGSTSGHPTDIAGLFESSRAISRVGSHEKGPITISKYFPIEKIYGRSSITIRGEKDYAAGVGANPDAVNGAINIHFHNIDGDTSTDFKVLYTLRYYCEFNNPVFLSGS